jgi:hypothetical protein
MKKILLIIIIILLLGVVTYIVLTKNKLMYYSYEDKFVISSTANKVKKVKNLNNDYYIKENITKTKSKERLVEVLFSEGINEPYNTYGYYPISEFNTLFKDKIIDGFLCGIDKPYYLEEGNSLKCTIYDIGYKYNKIDSELCVLINNKEVCIKPNDWNNIEDYKKMLIDNGWLCEYKDYNTGEWTTNIPEDGVLECSKEKPSIRDHSNNDLYCHINTDGSATCGNNNGWCSIDKDNSTYCFGIK